uniref:B-block binding subunit of TFIIIC domain-containing protein n=1 Tax=Hyaloperonospora arabidopsidis (strain Emoy2) TaxID=559515 RepID=M4BL00_HYAAE
MPSPRELVAACMDHIALEGGAGVSVADLFSSVDPHNDVLVRCQVWRLLRSNRGVLRFFRSSTASVSPAPSKKRPRPGSSSDKDSEERDSAMKREMLEAHRVGGAAATAVVAAEIMTAELSKEELELLTYDKVVHEQQQQKKELTVAACEELRHRALNIPVKAIAADLGDAHFRILEAVGRARVQGVTVLSLIDLLRGGNVKRLHNSLDTLISYSLVVKRMMIVARPVMRRLNIIHLPRFAAEFKPQMFDESADFESDEQSKKILCAAAETYLKGLPTHSSVLSDLGRDLSLHKRHLEVLRSHIVQECKVDDNFPLELFQAVLQPTRRASLEAKILNCVRYKPPNTGKNSVCRRGIVLELGLLRQIYGIIEDSAEHGATIIDLRNQIVLPGSKLPYKLVSVLAGMYSLKAESVILGKNKAFRLYLDTMTPNAASSPADVADSPLVLSTQSKEGASEETAAKVKAEGAYTVRSNKALKVALGAEVDGTSARRREHILGRLENEKIISLSSLCASVFSMEKQRAEMNVLSNSSSSGGDLTLLNNGSSPMLPAAVGKVDARSIFRIAAELETAQKLRLLQLPLPARNVSTKFRALRCVVAPGYEQNDLFIQGYVKNYCRDERLRRIYRNTDKSQVVRFHAHGSDNSDVVEHRPVRKRRRRRTKSKVSDAKTDESAIKSAALDAVSESKDASSHAIPQAPAVESEVCNLASPEISYKIWRFVSQQKSRIHNQQYRKLGFAYGVMYRCKVLHRFLWKVLHENGSNLQLPGDDSDLISPDLTIGRDGGHTIGGQKQQQQSAPGIVFSRESVLHSMPLYLYIQVFSGGAILTGTEFAVVEEAIEHQRTFEAIPEALRKKIWSHESQRTAKVLGTLADLGLVLPHKIGMKHLVSILRAGYTDGRDGVLSRALNENALGGLFRFNKQARILIDEDSRNDGFVFTDGRVGSSDFISIRAAGFTEKTYSFGNLLPLRFSFEAICDVDRYWEALECLCLEQMTTEVDNPRKNEPVVCGVPKPVKTRARRMMRILAWIPKSRKVVPKHKRGDGSESTHCKSSGIVSTNIRLRRKRRLSQHGDELSNDHNVQGRKKKKHRNSSGDEDRSKSGVLTWTEVHEKLLVDYFIDSSKSRWRITVPQGLQRDNEQVAFRNSTISRTGLGLVAITRKLGKRKIDVKKRLKEKLMEPVVKLLFENAKQEAQLAYNPSGLFDEEFAIQGSTRLTALFRRAVMMIVSPREEYHPLVAEELISYWTPHEIRLVWRYLWLKNWIVRASEKERGRGYSTSQRLQDSLKVSTLSYPLLLFQQAAERESIICSALEELTAGSNEARYRGGLHESDQLFEDDFPANATPGQCALELGCQVLGTCSLVAVQSLVPDLDTEVEDALETQSRNGKRLPSPSKRRTLMTCNGLKDRSGFFAHLASKVNVAKSSDLIDTWSVETKMHTVTAENAIPFGTCEAFSIEEADDRGDQEAVACRIFLDHKEPENTMKQTVMDHVCQSGEEGLTLSALVEKLRASKDDEVYGVLQMRVAHCLNSLVDQGVLICVNAYFDQRYISKEHGDLWLLRPFSLVPSASYLLTPQVVFEGEKDTLSFPWLKMNGGANYKFLFAIQRKLLALVIQAPGITEKRAHAKVGKLLSLQDTREAMSLLVVDGLVYVRAVTNAAVRATGLFTSSVTQPSNHKVIKLVGSVLACDRSVYEVHYFPHVECVQRFGSIVQDYQNEAFPNDRL